MLNAFEEFSSIIELLQRSNVRYALVGGVAMAYHGLSRFTKDVDLLVHPDDADKIKEIVEKKGYFESAKPWTFKNTGVELRRFMKIEGQKTILIDLLVALQTKDQQIIERALRVESENGIVPVASREDLITMKLARNSLQDQADIEGLKNAQD